MAVPAETLWKDILLIFPFSLLTSPESLSLSLSLSLFLSLSLYLSLSLSLSLSFSLFTAGQHQSWQQITLWRTLVRYLAVQKRNSYFQWSNDTNLSKDETAVFDVAAVKYPIIANNVPFPVHRCVTSSNTLGIWCNSFGKSQPNSCVTKCINCN